MDRGRRRAPPQRFTDDADGGGNADDDHGGTSGVSVKCRVAPEINHVLQTIFQHAGSDVQTGVLDMLDLSQLDWKSNSGIVIEALLHCVGLRWSRDGKRVWRVAKPEDVIEWVPKGERAGRASLRPASRGPTVREEVEAAGVEHDASIAKVEGSAAQAAVPKWPSDGVLACAPS
jgi:hypothetical protein